ncbi:MAG: energy-coupled thiamine transporter ThiT [Clostridia bacterium]|nr:energy-coupled thiamine transporter ThiT [Clostridia bacterium]
MKVNNKTFKLVFSALMVALSVVLSFFKIEFLYGGSITIFSMVPLVLVAQMYGVPWGFLTGMVYGLIQMVMGFKNFGYVTGVEAYAIVASMDYLVAFGMIGFAGITRKIRNRAVAASLGSVIACILRFFCHFISGITVWKALEWNDAPAFISERMLQPDMVPYTYSLFYNGGYMFPELILTTIGSAILCTIMFEAFKIDVNAKPEKKLKATAEANLSDDSSSEEK